MAEVTSTLLERLRRHYLPPGPLPGGIFVDEVGTNDWNAGGRRCDAVYVGFTGTSGRHLIGHELKTSRADWRAELAKPGKADLWADLVETLVDLTRTKKAVQQLTGRALEILRALDTLQAGMNPQLAKWADEAENLRTLLH